jgi:hypothetical protein
MEILHETPIRCPYCGEPLTVLIDRSVAIQEYVEDCTVCCQPITLVIAVGPGGDPQVQVRRDDE